MKKLRLFMTLSLLFVLLFTFSSCKETNKYKISDVKNVQNLKIDKKNTSISFDVNGNNDIFDINNIVISKGTIVPYSDSNCEKELSNKLSLNEGANTFYFKVKLTKGDKLLKTVWTLSINKLEKDVNNSVEIYSIDTTYVIGDTFKGGTLKVVKDGETSYVDITIDMVTGFSTEKAGTFTLTITYQGIVLETKMTVVENGQALIPNYEEIQPSQIPLDEITKTLLRTLVKINLKPSEEMLDEIVERLIEEEDDLYETSKQIAHYLKPAGITEKQLDECCNLIIDNFIDFDPEEGLSGLFENLFEIITRVVKILSTLQEILEPVQIGMIGYTFYLSDPVNIDEINELLVKYEKDPLFSEFKKMIDDTNKLMLSRNEAIFLTINIFKELTTTAKGIETNYAGVMTLVGKISSITADTVFTKEDLVGINGVGQLLKEINLALTDNEYKTSIDILEKINKNHLSEFESAIQNKEIFNVLRNIRPTLKFLSELLINVEEKDLDKIKNLVMTVSYLSIINELPTSENEVIIDFYKNLIGTSKLIINHFDKMSQEAQMAFKTSIYNLLETNDAKIDFEKIRTHLRNLSNIDSSAVTIEKAKEMAVIVLDIIGGKTYLDVTYENQVIVKENLTIDELVNALNENVTIKWYFYENGSIADSMDITLDKTNILNFDELTPGMCNVIIKVKDITYKLVIYITPNNEESTFDFESFIDETSIAYDQATSSWAVDFRSNYYIYLRNKQTSFLSKVKVDLKDFDLSTVDTTTKGIKEQLVKINLEGYGSFIIPLKIYVIDSSVQEVTNITAQFSGDIYSNQTNNLKGQITVEYNYGIEILSRETGTTVEKIFMPYNPKFVMFTKENIKGLDITKIGKQTVTIEVGEFRVNTEVEVLDNELQTKILKVYIDDAKIYKGFEYIDDVLRLTIEIENTELSYRECTFTSLKKFMDRGLIPFDISYEVNYIENDTKAEITLKVIDTRSGEEFTDKKVYDLFTYDEFYQNIEFYIYLDDQYFSSRDPQEIVKNMSYVTIETAQVSFFLEGERARKWLLDNATFSINDEERTLTLTVNGYSCVLSDACFILDLDMTSFSYSAGGNGYLPQFLQNFTDEDIFNGIISDVIIYNVGLYSNQNHNLYQLFKEFIRIEKVENTSISIYINNKLLNSFTLATKDQYQVFLDMELKDNILLDNLSLNTLKDELIRFDINVSYTDDFTNIRYTKNTITDSLMNQLSITKLPETLNHDLILSFDGKDNYIHLKLYTNKEPDVIESFYVSTDAVLYNEQMNSADLINYVQFIYITYTNGKNKTLNREELTQFLKNECDIFINEDGSVEVTHNASGVKSTIEKTRIRWFDISKMNIKYNTLEGNTYINCKLSDNIIEDPLQIIDTISLSFSYNGEQDYLIYFNDDIARFVGVNFLDFNANRLLSILYISYTIDGTEYSNSYYL